MATYSLTVGGAAKTIHLPSLDFKLVSNGRDYLRVAIISAGGAYRPSVGDEVILTEDSTDIFGGIVAKTTETGISGLPIDDIATEITCDAFNVYADKVHVTETFAAGSTLEDVLGTLVTNYLADFGVTLSGSQPTGPTFSQELVFNGEALSSVLQTLTELSEDAGTGESWLWEIDPSKVFLMFEAGSVAAPIDFVAGDGHESGDITVVRSRDKYANRVIVRYGDNRIVKHTDSFTGDGTTDTFNLSYKIQGPFPFVGATEAVGYGIVNHLGGESLGGTSSPMIWHYDPTVSPPTIERTTGAPGNAVAFSIDYDVQFPQVVTAEDAGEIAANGPYEIVLSYPNVYDAAVATGLAQAALAKLLTTLTEIDIPTYQVGLLTGQTMTVTQPKRSLSGSFLITEVWGRSTPIGIERTVRAVSGDVFRGSYRDVYRAWLDKGASGVATGGPTMSTGGGGVPSPPTRSVQFNNAGAFGGSSDFTWGSTDPLFGGFPANLMVKVADEARYNLALVGPASSSDFWLFQVFGGGDMFANGGRDWFFQPSRDFEITAGREIVLETGDNFADQVHIRGLASTIGLALGAVRTVATTYEIDVTGATPLTTIYAVPTTNNTNIVFPSLTTAAANPASGQHRVLVTRHDSTANTVILRPKTTGESINNSSQYTMTPLETVVWQGLTGTGAGWKPIARFSSST